MSTFMGYRRPDGKVGIRNKVLVLPASICATDVAVSVAAQVENAVSFHNQNGCSQVPEDSAMTMDVMSGMAANPNIYGTVVISLGCETCQMDLVVDEIRKKTNKPLEQFIIQENGGTIATTERAVRAVRRMCEEASRLQREAFPLDTLVLGTECGGSDITSGLASNPAIGNVCDWLVDSGGTAILSETTEFIGAEHILARRAETPAVRDRILGIVRRYEEHLALVGADVREGNPSPGNNAGGITTLEEKSLGCIYKGGHRPIREVFDYAKPVTTRGLVIMDTPGNDPSSVAGMVAGGAQLILFSTGRGTPTGNPVSPVIKITGNRETYRNMKDNIDADVSRLIDRPEEMSSCVDELRQLVLDVANGMLTRSESLGITEMAIARLCNYV